MTSKACGVKWVKKKKKKTDDTVKYTIHYYIYMLIVHMILQYKLNATVQKSISYGLPAVFKANYTLAQLKKSLLDTET